METMQTGIVPTLDYSRGLGYGNGFGYDNSFFWIIVILFAFMNNGMWGRNGFGIGNMLETDVDTRFLERDIFNTNQNVSTTGCQTQRDVLETKYDLGTQVLENRYANQLGVQSIISSQKDCCCETNRNIDSVRYDALLNAKNAQLQLSECCCELKNAIHAEGEATRSMIQADKIEQLRDQVFATNQALNNANLATNIVNSIIPRPAPAYPSCSPFVPSFYGFNGGNGCGCNNVVI